MAIEMEDPAKKWLPYTSVKSKIYIYILFLLHYLSITLKLYIIF